MLEEVWEGSVNMRPLCSYKYIKQAMPRERETRGFSAISSIDKNRILKTLDYKYYLCKSL